MYFLNFNIMGKKKKVKHISHRSPKKKKLIIHKHKSKKKELKIRKLLQRKKVSSPVFEFPKIKFAPPSRNHEVNNNLTGSTEVLHTIDNKKKIETKNQKEIKKEIKKNDKKPKSAKGQKIFLLILFIIIGFTVSYFFSNLYVLLAFSLLILFQIISIIKTPKAIKKEENKVTKVPDQPKKIYITEFDKFYNYIVENKSVSTVTIASHFRMTKKQVEDWAKILESRGLIIVHYPLIGAPILKSIE